MDRSDVVWALVWLFLLVSFVLAVAPILAKLVVSDPRDRSARRRICGDDVPEEQQQ